MQFQVLGPLRVLGADGRQDRTLAAAGGARSDDRQRGCLRPGSGHDLGVGEQPSDEVEDADDLFSLDPAQFVAMRNALVRRLKGRGDADAAAEVATLRRPPRSAWALNRLARTEPGRISAVLSSAEAVASSLHGGGDGLRTAQADYTEAVGSAVDAAAALAGVEGDTMRSRMRATLLAAGADPQGEVAAALAAGTLLDDHEAPGFSFGAVVGPAGVATPSAPPRPRSGGAKIGARRRARPTDAEPGADADRADADRAADDAAEQERVTQERRAAIRRRRDAERDLERLQKRADRLAAQADDAAAKAAALRADADAAADEVAGVEQRLAELIDELARSSDELGPS